MSENTPPQDPSAVAPIDPAVAAKPTRRKRRWKRWLLIGVVGLPVFAAVGVLLLPTVLSLGPVRSMTLSFAAPKVAPNGSLKIDSWSFAWFGGQKISGITLFDDQNAAVAHLNVETGASLLALARGDYDLKQTNVTGDFDVRRDPATGRVNVLHILGVADPAPAAATQSTPETKPSGEPKAQPKSESKPAEPTKIPDLKGKVHVAMTGTVSSTDPNDKSLPFTKVEKADLDVDLTDIDKGIALNGTIRASIDGKPARIVVSGTADAIENHVIVTDLNKIGGKFDVAIEQVDLAVVKVALAASAAMNHTPPPDVDVAGLMKGKIAVDIVAGGAATITSDALGIDNLNVVAPQLKGDSIALKRVDFPLSITRDATTSVFTIASTGLRTDLASVDVSGTLPQVTLQNLIDRKAPGAAGQIVVKTDVPSFVALAKTLPHTLALPQDTTITGGKLKDTLTLDLLAGGAKVGNALTLDAQGTQAGKSIELKSTSANTSASVALRDGLIVDPIKDIRDIAIDVAAPFATIKGGGTPAQLAIDGNLDLARLFADVSQFHDFSKVDATKGLNLNGQTTFSVKTNGDPTNLATPLDAMLTFDAKRLTVGTAAQSYLDNETINGSVDLLYKQTDTANLATVQTLKVSSADSLIGIWTAGDPLWVQWPITNEEGTFAGKGELHVRSTKLDRLIAMAGKPADPKTQVTAGTLDSTLTLASDASGANYTITTKTDVTKLDVGKLLKNETISLNSSSRVPAAMTSATNTFDLTSEFATVKGDADVLLKGADGKPPMTLAMVRSANFTGDVPSLPKLYGLAIAISPPAVVKDAATGKPLPPMSVDGGSLAFTGKVTRDDANQLTSVTINVPGIKNLQLSRGDATFSPSQSITFAMTADLTTNNNPANPDTTKASILDNVNRAIASIDLNAPGLATMKTSTPLDVAGFKQSTPSAKGVLHTTASLGPVFNLLTVVSGSPPKPLAGELISDQTIATTGNAVQITGTGKVAKLTPTGPDAEPLPAQLQTIDLTNDVSIDLSDAKAMAVTITKVDVVAPDARDALSVNVTGKLRNLGTNNDIDNLIAKVSYDVPQLWPIFQPILDPTGTSLGKVDNLAGKYAKTFAVSGSYPTATADGKAIAFNDSIKSLVVSGDLQIDKATLTDKGVDVANVSLPISLKGGIAKIAFADGTSPKPMTLNTGTADLGGLSVDLAGAEPILGDVKSKQLVKGATLNPVLSNALGKFFNPIFPNATKATANIDVVLTSTGLHLGKSLTTTDSGNAVVVLSLTDLVIANPLSENLLGGVVNQVSKYTGQSGVDTKNISDLTGEMKDATFTLDRGVVTQDATFMIGNKGAVDDKGQPKRYPFKFAGDVQLSSLAMNLTAGFPMGLLKDKLKGDAADILAYAPDNLNLGLTGTTSAPKLDKNALSKTLTEAFAKFGTSKLLGGKGDKNGVADDGKKTDKQKLGDLIGGLLGDKKGATADPATPGDATPPADDPDDAPKKKKKKKSDDN